MVANPGGAGGVRARRVRAEGTFSPVTFTAAGVTVLPASSGHNGHGGHHHGRR